MTTRTEPAPITGYLRLPGRPWQAVAEGDDYKDVSAAVDAAILAMEPPPKHCETYVGTMKPPMNRGAA
jgi:pectin methylesterase-like acyl-CoA thioesterase